MRKRGATRRAVRGARHIAAVPPPFREVSVIAQDPSVLDARGNILMARIRLPAERLEPGPLGYRVHIVDYDATAERYYGAHRLPELGEEEPTAWRAGRKSIVDDKRFHAQNVYALVMMTLARFERALGRRVRWSFKTHQLKVAPHGLLDANAFYAPRDEGLVFGYFAGVSEPWVYTCLSHDVVVHETAHALLDALRERFLDPSSPDQAAFHEGFSDIVALLSVFAQRELVLLLLQPPDRRTSRRDGGEAQLIDLEDLSPQMLRESALLGLAEQMGLEIESLRGAALRRSASLPAEPDVLNRPEYLEPHRRGEVLVAAVMNAFVEAWSRRIRGLAVPGQTQVPLARAAEEGADIAEVLLTLWIRALDYTPPVHLQFSDALAAALTADLEARPDDSRFALRETLRSSFARYGIETGETLDPATGTWVRAPADLRYDNIRFESLRSDEDEVFRFMWDNRDQLGLRESVYTRVLSVRPCTRVGVDGFTLRETVAEYYQVADVTAAELRREHIEPPAGWERAARSAAARSRRRVGEADANGEEGADATRPTEDEAEDATRIRLHGGGTLIFDEFGRLKFHVHNDVFGSEQQARLGYLWESGQLRTSNGNRGESRLSPERLSSLHRLRTLDARRFPREGW